MTPDESLQVLFIPCSPWFSRFRRRQCAGQRSEKGQQTRLAHSICMALYVCMYGCMILHDMHDMDDMDVCVSVCLYVCVCVSHMFRIQRGFTYVFTCVAYTLHMHFTHALHTFHKVIMYVSYWFGTQITYVSHAFYIHMFCMRKRLRICIRTPLSGSYRRKP